MLQLLILLLCDIVASEGRINVVAMASLSRRNLTCRVCAFDDCSHKSIASDCQLRWQRASNFELSNHSRFIWTLPSLRSTTVGEWTLPSTLKSDLGKTRILTNELAPIKGNPVGDQELYYASFLFGSWKVKATLKHKVYPYGTEYVPSTSFVEGNIQLQ